MPAKKAAKKAAPKTPSPKAAKKAATKAVAAKAAKKAAAPMASERPSAGKTASSVEVAAYLNYRSRTEKGLPGDHIGDWLAAEKMPDV